MTADTDSTDEVLSKPRYGRRGAVITLAAAGIGIGAVAASAIAASATTTAGSGSTTSTSAYTATTNPGGTAPPGAKPNGQAGGSTPVRSDEKAVSATIAAKLKAAALKAVPGGTVYRVETDAGDATYEAHMTKADGTLVTVKFDKNLTVTKVESGMGAGDPAPAGGQAPAGGKAPAGGTAPNGG
jgi:hypothetical protein